MLVAAWLFHYCARSYIIRRLIDEETMFSALGSSLTATFFEFAEKPLQQQNSSENNQLEKLSIVCVSAVRVFQPTLDASLLRHSLFTMTLCNITSKGFVDCIIKGGQSPQSCRSQQQQLKETVLKTIYVGLLSSRDNTVASVSSEHLWGRTPASNRDIYTAAILYVQYVQQYMGINISPYRTATLACTGLQFFIGDLARRLGPFCLLKPVLENKRGDTIAEWREWRCLATSQYLY